MASLFERLETRVLLHSITLGTDGVVRVVGENTNQTIQIDRPTTQYRVRIFDHVNGGGVLHDSETFSSNVVTGFLASGAGGDDTLIVDPGVQVPVTLRGGDGADQLTAASPATLEGNGGNDTLNASAGASTLNGGDGDDVLKSFNANALLIGGSGTDTADYAGRLVPLSLSLDGLANDGAAGQTDNLSSDIETIQGGNANDLIVGNDGANVLLGNGGKDTLRGNGGNDTLAGGTKNDRLDGGTGADELVGGAGLADTADYSGRVADLSLTLDSIANDGADGEGDTISPTIENLAGGAGDDLLQGSGRPNVLSGNAGDDTILAGSGDDHLHGGPGADQLFGHAGNDHIFAIDSVIDTLSGGSGIDVAESDAVDLLDSIP